MPASKIGFVINPIAGMGGRVGLKGTDGVLVEALKRGAEPVAIGKAQMFLDSIKSTFTGQQIEWHTAGGAMGEAAFKASNVPATIDYSPKQKDTSSSDTIEVCKSFIDNGCRIVIFCGGDGTARDVYSVIKNNLPMLGIPSGVKMHSAVFGVSPKASAELLMDYLQGGLELQSCEIIDLDEELYRQGTWSLKLYGIASMPYEPAYVQGGKLMIESVDEDDAQDAIANYVIDEFMGDKDVLFIIGPGSTTMRLGEKLGIDKTLLGIDCIANGKLVMKDVSEKDILGLLGKYDKTKIIVSPIGAQGFIFGRGNLQISDEVLEKVGLSDIIIISTPSKLARTPLLRIDLNSQKLKNMFREKNYVFVITGYQDKMMRNIAEPE